MFERAQLDETLQLLLAAQGPSAAKEARISVPLFKPVSSLNRGQIHGALKRVRSGSVTELKQLWLMVLPERSVWEEAPE